MVTVICSVIAYCLGSISPSIILGKLYGIDVRNQGSGNAGTTNVLRTMGGKAAIITLLIDILKGSLAVLIGRAIGGNQVAMVCALFVIIGHIWPIFYKLRGGKGVATAFGAITAIYPPLGGIGLAVAVVFTLASKRMSVGSLAGAISFPLVCYFLYDDFLTIGILMVVIIIFKHRGNIQRLIKGEEPPMSIFVKKGEKD